MLPEADGSDTVRVADLRFSELRPAPGATPAQWVYPFAWRFPRESTPGADIPLAQVPADFGARGAGFDDVWHRLLGHRDAW